MVGVTRTPAVNGRFIGGTLAEFEGGQEQGGAGEGEGGFEPITSQDQLNAALKDRLQRERAKYADYADLKQKAKQFEELQQANKTEAQKTADRIAALEQELTSTKTDALRARVQARFGIANEDAELFLTASDEETLTKQAERLAERSEDRKKQGNRAPLQGRTSNKSGNDDPLRDLARGLFKSDD